ncbi:hypothetical protein Mgra_00007307, partial [Meloidogyne graminicola]
MMVYNINIIWLFNDICYAFFSLFCAIFLLIVICPLFKFSKERTALYILFSKSLANCFSQFISIIQISCKHLLYKSFYNFIYLFAFTPLTLLTYNAAYFHMLALAINRFHAVFFAFTYQNWWNKSRVKYFILIIWLITFIWTAIQYRIFELMQIEKKDVGIFSIIQNGILISSDLPLLTSLIISLASYITVLIKFYYDYRTKNINNNTKERVLMLTVCLVSTTPCFFL